MRTLRTALISPTMAGRLLVSLFAGAAIIVGLLAMHTMNADADDMAPTSAVSVGAVMPDHHAHVAATAGGVDCGIACPGDMPSHDMSVMACVLALLMLLLVIGVPAIVRLRTAAAPPGPASRWPSTAIAAQPPSLQVLSISRT